MPQFNWSIFGPFVLAVAAIAGGIAYLFSMSPGHPRRAVEPAAGAPLPARTAAPAGLPSTPVRGLRLRGRVMGTPHLRAEPNSNAPVLRDLQNGEQVEISACSPACGWYLLTSAGQTAPGWVSAAFIAVQGDDRGLPVVK